MINWHIMMIAYINDDFNDKYQSIQSINFSKLSKTQFQAIDERGKAHNN